MKLKIKFLKLSAGRPVAILNKKTAEKLNVHIDERVGIRKNNKKIIAVIDLASGLLSENQIVVSTEISKFLKTKENDIVDISLAPEPESIILIQKKLKGIELKKEEIKKIIQDIVNNALTESEIAYFVSSIYNIGMSFKEIIYLTSSIVETGRRLGIRKKIVDKHSIGGIPNNRTTPIIVSICSSLGLIMPKTSSRAITSAAGTADVIETLCRVNFTIEELRRIVKKTNACFVWGGSLGLAPADDKIIQVERLLNLDPESQLLASIMAKKLAVGSDYILIDIPYGKNAKVNRKEALRLKRKFEKICRHFKIKIRCILTDGSQPIGNGIGPALEMKDVVSVLKNNGPEDLRKKSLFLSGQLLELVGKTKKGQGEKLAEEILSSGKAFKKFKEIVEAQGGRIKNLKTAKYSSTIKAGRRGKIKEINNKKIAYLARLAGCPTDKYSGLYLFKHLKDKIAKGEKILIIYSESKDKLKEATDFYNKEKPIKI